MGYGYSNHQITAFTLDGEQGTRIVDKLDHPVSLTLDEQKNRIYWADQSRDRIESVRIDGSDRRKFKMYLGTLSHIAVLQNTMYWTTTDHGQLHWADITKKRTTTITLGNYHNQNIQKIN